MTILRLVCLFHKLHLVLWCRPTSYTTCVWSWIRLKRVFRKGTMKQSILIHCQDPTIRRMPRRRGANWRTIHVLYLHRTHPSRQVVTCQTTMRHPGTPTTRSTSFRNVYHSHANGPGRQSLLQSTATNHRTACFHYKQVFFLLLHVRDGKNLREGMQTP